MSSSRSATACGAGTRPRAGIEPALLSQFALLEEAVAALGIVVWPMVEFEADDALAAGAEAASCGRTGGPRRHLHA